MHKVDIVAVSLMFCWKNHSWLSDNRNGNEIVKIFENCPECELFVDQASSSSGKQLKKLVSPRIYIDN